MHMQKLKSEILNRASNGLGATEEGSAWCVKALHPSDPVSECEGIPDESAVPSAHMNFMSTFQFKVPTGVTGTWGFDMDVIPHPVAFGALHTYDAQVQNGETVALNNTQLTGSDHEGKYATFKSYAQRWRMTYMGVTLYQDGAALTNQGTLQACQRPVEGVKKYGSHGVYLAGALAQGMLAPPVLTYQTGDTTSFETVSNMPNAYCGRSADGAYMPLIMTSTCQKWHGEHDECMYGGIPTSSGSYGTPLPSSGSRGRWPFYDLIAGPYQATGDASVVMSDLCSVPASNIWGLFCARNLDPTTSFTAVFRSGWELQCQPGTLLTPQLHISPAYDPRALAAYFAIRRELKDAYPADFNDWAKIWGVIKRVASFVLPGISMMGPIGAAAGAAGSGVISVVDAITNAVAKKAQPVEQGRNQLSLAEKERAQSMVKAAATLNQLGASKALTIRRPRELNLTRAQLAAGARRNATRRH